MANGLPQAEGLYDPAFERDACGVGFVAHIDGRRSHDLIENGIKVLANLLHRGAAGSDAETGDGAGLLFQIPDTFFRTVVAPEIGIDLPPLGAYCVGMFFFPTGEYAQRVCRGIVEQESVRRGFRVLGWRDVPVSPEALGQTARASCPVIQQVFLTPNAVRQERGDAGSQDRTAPDRNPASADSRVLERNLYVLRRSIEGRIAQSISKGAEQLHIPSFSSRTICYKGLMHAQQIRRFYPDLTHESLDSALVVVHQRYSTNTFPTWPLAQPFRCIAHNGEINTLRGNISAMRARYATLSSDVFSVEEMERIIPVIDESGSDSACLDNALELLVVGGRNLPHAMMMMIPEAWGEKYYMGTDRRAFYEYHSMFMEPWDGPAAVVGTDGERVCATLDRNGLRPGRYVVTDDNLIVLASETGVLDIPPERVVAKGRLSPGKMLMVDTTARRLFGDEEIKAQVCRQRPYRRWVAANRIELHGLLAGTGAVQCDRERLLERQRLYDYTREDIDVLITPLAAEGKEPLGSMGDDTPLAVLSHRPQLLFNYFKQLFAQVTNPPIDPVREELVMSLTTYLGCQGNILSETPEHARMLKLRTPILTADDLAPIRATGKPEFESATVDILFDRKEGIEGLAPRVSKICEETEICVRRGSSVIILSDRDASAERVPVPSLLAVAAVNQHLVRKGIRTRTSLVLESGEPREIMHFALLLGYGASAVNPYLAMETIACMVEDGRLPAGMTVRDAIENYTKAVEKGLLKILSKMGISTLRSYRGGQVFQALGLARDFCDRYFGHTVSRIGGIDMAGVATETLERHAKAYVAAPAGSAMLEDGGRYRLRRGGERHLWSPDAIRFLQQATRSNSADVYRKFAACINDQDDRHCTLRSLLEFDEDEPAVDLEEVESASKIMKRFVGGAMSFGAISREAHETIAVAFNRIGCRSNSGEGGEDRARYAPGPDGGNRCSATKQVASGRFGVTTEYLVNASELQIKIAQGAKPGEGGQIPGHKVNVEIAAVRHSTPGVSLISPPPHHDIYSIEDLAQLIFDLKNVNPRARINVKLVAEAGVGVVAAGVAKGHADAVLISGGDGGTGASPLSSIKYAGIPWELGLSETQQVLVKNDLRGRIRVQTDGQMRTGRDVAVAALLGAEEFGFATALLIVLGCVMMRKCHENTCPMGVATQDPRLRKRFTGKPEYLINYLRLVAEELREIMGRLGFRTVDQMIGRSDRLKVKEGISHWKARSLELDAVLHRPQVAQGVAIRNVGKQRHDIDAILDQRLLQMAGPALERGERVEKDFPIRNVDRATGAMLSGEIARRHGHKGLADDTITLRFHGSAGQSFGAFCARGLTLVLDGDSNDYIGKGLSGGKIIVRPPAGSRFDPAENVVIGNVALYGATEGKAYFAGLAGERFAIRNSGALAVVEGVGDHGCEYMTGGAVVVLGRTGVNFAAGMSGGIAFVYDPHQDFDLRCNLDMVDLETVGDENDIAFLKEMIENHLRHTGSPRARWMLDDWEKTLSLFVKVMPVEYRRALGQMGKVELGSRRAEREVVVEA